MSGTVPVAFTDGQKADIRRFCGYPAYGAGVARGLIPGAFFRPMGRWNTA